ncbi:hypothetical protein GCM10023194_78540 [Planotetraspora phitsanulokensis]|uniref:Peptidase C51 domain-containing protein n=1 Tax=Planotetraspora phitsanulokensis TaxID=575192 RepID=A0A8J3UA85_9ACTN|nr:CHAP domain-containing protein [Planotetraspora phitsanulokensis]GII41140.1 hypothetical protein Pph01_61430 [Planotetraspora phitsanulokensis]
MSVQSMLAAARESLGLQGRPNAVTRDYAKRHGDEFLKAAWCDQAVTYWARKSGNAAAVLPNGDRAYTVWHAQDGQKLGRWFAGTAANVKAHAKPGAIVFFDWEGRDAVGGVDHVGVVERNLGDGRVQTIEGNTGDACKRRVRAASVIAGFWNPDYSVEDDVPEVVSLGAGVDQQVPANGEIVVRWGTEYVDDPKAHGDNGVAVLASGSRWCLCDALVRIGGLQPGDELDVSWARYDRAGKKFLDDAWRLTCHAGPDGRIEVSVGGQFGLGTDNQLRLRIINAGPRVAVVEKTTMAKVSLFKH